MNRFGKHARLIAALLFCSAAASPVGPVREKPAFVCEDIRSLMSDFKFVGQDLCNSADVKPRGPETVVAPSVFREGVCYSYLLPLDSRSYRPDRPIYEVLEEKLHRSGATVLHSPTQRHDAIHIEFGGPLFHVDFRTKRHSATIRAVQNPVIATDAALRTHWHTETFVLQFHP